MIPYLLNLHKLWAARPGSTGDESPATLTLSPDHSPAAGGSAEPGVFSK